MTRARKYLRQEECTTEEAEKRKQNAVLAELLNKSAEAMKRAQKAEADIIESFIRRGEMERGPDGKLRVPHKLILLKTFASRSD